MPIQELFPGGYPRATSRDRMLPAPPCGGRRIWMDSLPLKPGLVGVLRYLSSGRYSDPSPLEIAVAGTKIQSAQSTWKWYPDRVEMFHRFGDISLKETKYITEDDILVDRFEIHNNSSNQMEAVLSLDGELSHKGEIRVEKPAAKLSLISGNWDEARKIVLPPNGKYQDEIAVALTLPNEEVPATAPSIEAHQSRFWSFFEGIPRFYCSDKDLQDVYYYRWYVLRHSMAANAGGNLPYPCYYEGKHDNGEWLFSRIIADSVGHHLLDGRWHHDPSHCFGTVRNLVNMQDAETPYAPGKLFPTVSYLDTSGHWFLNLVAYAAEAVLRVHPSKKWARDVIDGLAEELRDNASRFIKGEVNIPCCPMHGDTAMEFQPSYFYFKGYKHLTPDNCWAEEHYDPVLRTDAASYMYANANAVASVLGWLGLDSTEFEKLARNVSTDFAKHSWNGSLQFFLDLHHKTLEPAPVKNIPGYFPFFAGLTGKQHLGAFEHLCDSKEFATNASPPTVAKSCEVYDPHNRWMGVSIHECLWNGPTWPFANSLLLQSIASAIKTHGYSGELFFAELLGKYVKLHKRGWGDDRDFALVEHYDAETGEPLSTVDEYFHSHFVDIIVRHVCGFEPELDGSYSIEPIEMGLEYFRMENIPFQGRQITISCKGDTSQLVVKEES